jgi:hypothetical protein
LATSATDRHVATRTVAATGASAEHQDEKQQDHDESDDPENLHPAWCADGVVAAVSAGVVVGGRVSQMQVLLDGPELAERARRGTVARATTTRTIARRTLFFVQDLRASVGTEFPFFVIESDTMAQCYPWDYPS